MRRGGLNFELKLFDLYEAYIPNLGLLRSLEPFKKFSVVGGGGGWVHSEYSVLLWSKALDLSRTKLNNRTFQGIPYLNRGSAVS